MTTTLLLGLTVAAGAPALKEKAAPATIVGEWAIEQCTVGGNPSQGVSNRWVFNADGTRSIVGKEGKEVAGGNYSTDPKDGTLDLNSTGALGMPYLCRFKVDGDTLTLNVGWQKAPRPPGFDSPPGSQCTLYVMKRVKKE